MYSTLHRMGLKSTATSKKSDVGESGKHMDRPSPPRRRRVIQLRKNVRRYHDSNDRADHLLRKSGKYRAAQERSRFWILFGFVGMWAGIATFFTSGTYAPLMGLQPVFLRYFSVTAILVGATVMMAALRKEVFARANFYESRERDAIAAAEKATREVASATDTLGLLNANQKQMEAYASIARGQAENSHRSSQVAMGTGLLVLLLGGVVVYFVPDTATKITAAALASVGTVIGGYISRTFIVVQRQASLQMGYYFGQPLVQSYVLNAERLAHQLNGDLAQQTLVNIANTLIAGMPSHASTIAYNTDQEISGK